jgi:cytochrome oxidase Cu insertion factor (SCO1/SenC/PrrC family)
MARTADAAYGQDSTSRTPRPLWQAALRGWYLLVLASGLLFAAAVLAWRALGTHEQLVGATVFDDRQPAPDFALTDHFGNPTSLSQFRGHPVALTFIYTHCPDVCPLIASNMHAAFGQFGGDASQVALLAVTVDPEKTTRLIRFEPSRTSEA